MNKILILLIILFPLILQAEPFPEQLKKSSQILVCYPINDSKSYTVRNRSNEWIITWGMAYEWFPNEDPVRILFKDTRGLITILPASLSKEYTCTAFVNKKKKKDKDKDK